MKLADTNLLECPVLKWGQKCISAILGAALAALLLSPASAPAQPSAFRHRTAYFGPLGLTTNSSARLNVLAMDNIKVQLLFLDSTGATVADSGPVTLAAGQAANLTLAGSSLTYASGALRAQVQARVRLLSHFAHSRAFASLELLDPESTVLVLYPSTPIRGTVTTTELLGPLTLGSTVSAGITVANLDFPSSPVHGTLSFYSADTTLLKQVTVTIEPGHTATLSMSGSEFSGPVIGTVSFDSSTAMTTSSLQTFSTATGITSKVLYPNSPVFSPIFLYPSNPI